MPVRFHRIYSLSAALKHRRRDTRDLAALVLARRPAKLAKTIRPSIEGTLSLMHKIAKLGAARAGRVGIIKRERLAEHFKYPALVMGWN